METPRELDNKVRPPLAGQYLRFLLRDECYGVSILDIQEIVTLAGHAPVAVPGSAPYLRGIMNLRGNAIPLIDLRSRFSIPESEAPTKSSAIIVHSRKNDRLVLVGFVVDHVVDVAWLKEEEIKSTPQYSGKLNLSYVQALAKLREEVVILIDSDNIIELSQDALIYACEKRSGGISLGAAE